MPLWRKRHNRGGGHPGPPAQAGASGTRHRCLRGAVLAIESHQRRLLSPASQPVRPYFPSILMLPSMSLSEWLGPKLSSRLLVSTRRPLLAPSVILPTRWV